MLITHTNRSNEPSSQTSSTHVPFKQILLIQSGSSHYSIATSYIYTTTVHPPTSHLLNEDRRLTFSMPSTCLPHSLVTPHTSHITYMSHSKYPTSPIFIAKTTHPIAISQVHHASVRPRHQLPHTTDSFNHIRSHGPPVSTSPPTVGNIPSTYPWSSLSPPF